MYLKDKLKRPLRWYIKTLTRPDLSARIDPSIEAFKQELKGSEPFKGIFDSLKTLDAQLDESIKAWAPTHNS